MLKSWYPILLIIETLDSICIAKFFMQLDVIEVFNYIYIVLGCK
jgi:hypothetical protein